MHSFQVTRLSRSSWFKLVIDGLVIHLDCGYGGFFENQHTSEAALEAKADLILITHPHKDHIRIDALNRIRKPSTKIYAPGGCIEDPSIAHHIVSPHETYTFHSLKIKTVDAYNTETGRSNPKLHPKGKYVGYIIEHNDYRIYFAGDTDYIPEMASFQGMDIAFLPIGGTYVMDMEEALGAVQAIRPRVVIPMHQANHDMTVFKQMVQSTMNIDVIILNVGDEHLF